MKLPKKPLALLSVYDKNGIVKFAQALIDMGWELLSSGGTAKALRKANLEVTDVAEWVGGGAILGHKVVTLSREVHAGLLADLNSPEDMRELESLGLKPIHLVCCDLYPLRGAIAAPDATTKSVLELTDIGGPTMIRSAAKGGRIVICRPEDRQPVLESLRHGTADDRDDILISRLRVTAERVIAEYCLASAKFHSGNEKGYPNVSGFIGTKVFDLTKGENGSQTGACYTFDTNDPLALNRFEQIHGSGVSYVTLTDIDRILATITHMAANWDVNLSHLPPPDLAVVAKHGNACGAAWGHDSLVVAGKAIKGDRRAAFGGLVMTNFIVTEEVAEKFIYGSLPDGQKKRILAGIVAPGFTPEALKLLKKKGGKRCGLWINPALLELNRNSLDTEPLFRKVRGGFLEQTNYNYIPVINNLNVQHLESESLRLSLIQEVWSDLLLADAVGRTSNSNSITLTNDGMLIGNGVNQPDRVGSAELALKRARDAGHDIIEAVAYSDSFFPFSDGPKVLANAGIVAILTSSGSVGDEEVFEFCAKNGILLVTAPDSEIRGFSNH